MNWFPHFLLLLASFALGVGDLLAQAKAGDEKKSEPPGRLRLLAIGDAPPHREEVINDIRVHLPPPPGTIPPRIVFAQLDPETRVEWNLQLGRFTPAVELPREMNRLLLSDAQSKPGAAPWLSLDLRPGGQHLAVLTRGGPARAWDSPSAILVPDDAAAFPAGRVFLLNLTGEEIAMQFGAEKFSLGARHPVFRDPGPVSGPPLKAARVATGGRQVFFYQGEFLLNPGERALVLVYTADGFRPRQPMNLLVLRERAPVVDPATPRP